MPTVSMRQLLEAVRLGQKTIGLAVARQRLELAGNGLRPAMLASRLDGQLDLAASTLRARDPAAPRTREIQARPRPRCRGSSRLPECRRRSRGRRGRYG